MVSASDMQDRMRVTVCCTDPVVGRKDCHNGILIHILLPIVLFDVVLRHLGFLLTSISVIVFLDQYTEVPDASHMYYLYLNEPVPEPYRTISTLISAISNLSRDS